MLYQFLVAAYFLYNFFPLETRINYYTAFHKDKDICFDLVKKNQDIFIKIMMKEQNKNLRKIFLKIKREELMN